MPPDSKAPCPVLVWYGGIWQPSKHALDLGHFFPSHVAVVAVETRTLTDATQDKAPAVYRRGLKYWAWVAQRPALYHALVEAKARMLGWLGKRRGRFRFPVERGHHLAEILLVHRAGVETLQSDPGAGLHVQRSQTGYRPPGCGGAGPGRGRPRRPNWRKHRTMWPMRKTTPW